MSLQKSFYFTRFNLTLVLCSFCITNNIFAIEYNLDRLQAKRIRNCGMLLSYINDSKTGNRDLVDRVHIVDLETPKILSLNENSFIGFPVTREKSNRIFIISNGKKQQLIRGNNVAHDSFDILDMSIDAYKKELLRSGLDTEIVDSIDGSDETDIKNYIQIESDGKTIAFSSAHNYTPYYRPLPLFKKAKELGFIHSQEFKDFLQKIDELKSKRTAVIEIGTTFISSQLQAHEKKLLHLIILFWTRNKILGSHNSAFLVSHVADSRFARFLEKTFHWTIEETVKDQFGNTHYLLSIESHLFIERIDSYFEKHLAFNIK